jgi:hypothetical protein
MLHAQESFMFGVISGNGFRRAPDGTPFKPFFLGLSGRPGETKKTSEI